MQAKAGDVYCIYNEKLKKYTACQITKVEDKDGKEMAVKLSLNWSGEEPLKEAELSELKPLYVDYMYWDNSLDMNNVEVDVPEKYIFVGNVCSYNG